MSNKHLMLGWGEVWTYLTAGATGCTLSVLVMHACHWRKIYWMISD